MTQDNGSSVYTDYHPQGPLGQADYERLISGIEAIGAAMAEDLDELLFQYVPAPRPYGLCDGLPAHLAAWLRNVVMRGDESAQYVDAIGDFFEGYGVLECGTNGAWRLVQ